MEEVITSIFHGFKVVKDLEMNLQNSANQPNDLIESCDEIVRIFVDARERLSVLEVAAYCQMTQHEMKIVGGLVQEWSSFSQENDMVVLHASEEFHQGLPENSRVGGIGGRELGLETTNARESGGGDMAVQTMDISDGAGGPAVQSTRRRNEADMRTTRVTAPRMGKTELPPEDGYTWRKYGQKEILGSRFPRAYYRCTHQKLFQCPAKKQVQRLDNDPYMFEVTYRGNHTCTMSTTPPSIPLPPNVPITTRSPPVLPAALVPLSHWLSMDVRTSGSSGTTTSSTTFHDMRMYRDQFGLNGPDGDGDGAGPSTIRYVGYPQQRVADLADAMFNFGSSSNNSLEMIFSSVEDKWEEGDQAL